MKPIKLAVALDASDFPSEVDDEMIDREISIHYDNSSFTMWWDDDSMPETKKWLVKTYGEDIKKYRVFAISAT